MEKKQVLNFIYDSIEKNINEAPEKLTNLILYTNNTLVVCFKNKTFEIKATARKRG